MKKYELFVGIDVSKSKLDVSFLNATDSNQWTHFVVTNTAKGLQGILTRLNKLKIDLNQVLICFEDTGVYSMPLCYFMSEKAVDYWMIPAIEIKRSKGISRGKTDKSDSKDIAFYAISHQYKLKLGSLPDEDLQKIKLLYSEREKLVKAIQMFERTNENIGFLPKKLLNDLLKSNASTIKKLKTSLKKIDKKIQELISENESLKEKDRLIQSIPGVGPQTSIYLLIVTRGFTSFENSRQLACYGGVAPFEYSSGSSIRGRTKVSHLADKKLKSLLNMCALNAKAYDHEMKLYYERKVAEGKSKMLVLNNIRNKILGRVFAVVNRGTPYVNIQKFAA